MGRKLDALMGKAFRSSKCKTALKLTVARIKILKNKRELQCKQSRRDVAQLLQNGQEASARLRVEQIFREQNIVDAYLLIGGYCETVSERILTIKTQKLCPNDLKESIASLIFAAPRCAELPELQDVRSLFSVKFGKEFEESAVELRPDCGVNKRIIEKLSTKVPSTEMKLRLMKEIASEHGIQWNFEESEAENLKPTEDILDGPRAHVGTKQMTSKPQDSIDKRTEILSISSKVPDIIRKQGSGTPKVDVTHMSPKGEEFPSIKQVYGESANADVYNSNILHAEEESFISPSLATNVDSNISEDDFYAKKRMEGKMDYTMSTENVSAYQNTDSNSHHDFVEFTKRDGLSPGSKQENIKYLDVASAAQAAFESAAYAAAAARAAVELARGESGNKKLNHGAKDSRDSMSESEDGLDEAILRTPNEVKYAMSHGVGSVEDTFSTKNDQARVLESPRTRNGENDFFSTGPGFERIHYDKKEVPDTESVGELSEDEAVWSKAERSYVDKSSHVNLNEDSDSQVDYEFNTLSNDRKPNHQQMNIAGVETRFERSTSEGMLNSGEQSSSDKDARPLFDDYGDDEDDFENNIFDVEKNNSEGATYQTTLTPTRSLGTEDTQPGYARYRSNQSQIHDSDEDDGYEKGTGRRDYKNQDSTPKTLGPIKLSYGEFVPRNKYSPQYYDHESEDEMEALKDDTDVKSQFNREVSMVSSPPNASYQSSHRMPSKKINGGTVSVDHSIYPGDTEIYRKYTNSQASDDEGVYRYEGNGKLSWRPAKVAERPVTVANHKSHHANTRMSVRTRR